MSDTTIAIRDIEIGQRVRRAMGDIDALAVSMRDVGLLQPIVVTDDNRLIAGERRILAAKQLGWDAIPVRRVNLAAIVLGEHAENECREGFTPSERVAIGRAVEVEIGNRRGRRTDLEPVQDFAQVESGQKTRDIAASRAGFGNPETYRQAKAVVDKGHPDLVQAMDAGDIAISAAAEIAKLPPAQQPERARELIVEKYTGEFEWYTPPDAVNAARRVLGEFDLDPASNEIAQRTVQAAEYYTKETNGLDKPWTGRVWMNPPYAADLIGKFVSKLTQHVADGSVSSAIMLVDNKTDTQWFHEAARHASRICFSKGRVRFLRPGGDPGTPMNGSAYFYFGPDVDAFEEVFSEIGLVVRRAR